MRKVITWLLMLLILTGCISSLAEEGPSAYDLALQMAETVPEMTDIKEAPLENGAQNRAIWTDTRVDLKCDLVVYGDADEALRAAVTQSTRKTAVRNVGECVLSLNSGLGVETILSYQQALAGLLGVELPQGEIIYILNVNTHKLHLPACESVAQIKETNQLEYYEDYSGNRELLIEQGYEPCQKCKP